MRETVVQSEYGFRARAQFSYNPDNDIAQSNKRKRRIIKSKTSKSSKSNKYSKADLHHDCESSEDKHTVVTLSSSKSGDFQSGISFDQQDVQSTQFCSFNQQNTNEQTKDNTMQMDLFQSLLEDNMQIMMF